MRATLIRAVRIFFLAAQVLSPLDPENTAEEGAEKAGRADNDDLHLWVLPCSDIWGCYQYMRAGFGGHKSKIRTICLNGTPLFVKSTKIRLAP